MEMLRDAITALEAGTPTPSAALLVREVTASDAGTLVSYERGHPTVVVLYYASCPRAHVRLAYAHEVAARYEGAGLTVRAFAWGHTDEGRRVG